jgi:hypothetical protein
MTSERLKQRGIRDIFRREFQNVEENMRSGGADVQQSNSKLAHFGSVMFLKDVTDSRKTDRNMSRPHDVSDDSGRSTKYSEVRFRRQEMKDIVNPSRADQTR